MLRRGGQVWHTLDRGRPGADDADALSGKVLQLLAGVAVVPAAGVEGVTAKRVDAGNAGQLGLGLVPVGHGYELGAHFVAPVGSDDPAGSRGFPTDLVHIGLQARVAVQVVVFGDAAAVRKDLGALGVFLRRYVAELLEQRDVYVGFDVAGDPRIAVPVPGAAHVGRPVDQPDAFHTELAKPHAGQQPTEAGADDRHINLVGERLARGFAVHPGVLGVPGELTGYLDILSDPVRAQPPRPLFGVLFAQRIDVKRHTNGFSQGSTPLLVCLTI